MTFPLIKISMKDLKLYKASLIIDKIDILAIFVYIWSIH